MCDPTAYHTTTDNETLSVVCNRTNQIVARSIAVRVSVAVATVSSTVRAVLARVEGERFMLFM